jgi:MFS family permease
MTKFRGRPQILVVLALTNMIAYAVRNALFAVYPDLTARYGADDAELGLLATVFMVPHAVATLGFGWAGDRFDRRRVIAFGMALASVAGVLGTFGASYFGLASSRAVVGFGTAAVVPVANSILGQIFEGPNKAILIAIFNLGLFVGGVLGFGLGAAVGFPAVVTILAIPGAVLAIVLLALPVPRHPGVRGAGTSGAMPRATDSAEIPLGAAIATFISDARTLLSIRTLRWVIASTTVMAFAAGGIGAWLQAFLVRPIPEGKGMSEERATMLLGLALVGGLSGIVVGARISDVLRRRMAAGRMWTIVIGMVLTMPCAAAAILLPDSIALYAIGVLTMFFISWYHAPMAATVDELAPPRLAVSAQALVIITMHLFGTAPASWVVGEVSKHSSLGLALWVPTAALVVAAICMAIGTTTFAADGRGGTIRADSL